MILVYPSAILVFPVFIALLIKRNWIKWIVILTIPFMSLKLFVFAGHYFTLPEVAILILGIERLYEWSRNDTVIYFEKTTLLLGFSFLILGTFSSLYLFTFPPDTVLTHPFNSGALDRFLIVKMMYTKNNITQSLLRIFTFISIFLLSLSFSKNEIENSVAILVPCGILVGAVGILYQLFYLADNVYLIHYANSFGFISWKTLRPFYGSIPRYYSLPGEPGSTAHYLLFLLGITVPLAISGDGSILTKKNAQISSILLLVFIVLSGSGTGFGGLIILTGILFTYYILIKQDADSIATHISTVFAGGIVLLAILYLIAPDPLRMLEYIFEKLNFATGSGTLRARYILLSYDIFTNRPIIGFGFGSHYGASVFGTVLVSTGFLGLLLYLSFHGIIIRDLIRINQSVKTERRTSILALSFMVSLATLFGTMLFAKSITATLFPWYLLVTGFGIRTIIAFANQHSSPMED